MGTYARTPHPSRRSSDLRGGHRPIPSLVQWMVTLDCQLTCPHCLAAGDPVSAMDVEAARALVDQVADAGVEELLLTGGEPLSSPLLPAIVEQIAQRGQAWSLNTARLPTGRIRDVLQRHPPDFVAVSLDGPRRVHDAFRGRIGSFDEALESMRFFRALGSQVAAGTTVTRRNIASLTHTLRIVHDSPAQVWGLHLLVPEGRAADRPDLRLRRRELRRLVRFVEDKRNYVPLEMADELGFCGEREPLLRNLPMTCGAGRMQCVVLPDGEVVPCTTLDRTASAGNVTTRPLLDIWRDGFGALRQRRPEPRCQACDYFAACGGGCWLQTHDQPRCYRDVWERTGQPRAAAGLAVALGLLSASGCSAVQQPAPETDVAAAQDEPPADAETDGHGHGHGHGKPELLVTPAPEPAPDLGPVSVAEAREPLVVSGPRGEEVDLVVELGAIEAVILRLTLDGPSTERVDELQRIRPESHADDPGWVFVESYAAGRLPGDLSERARAVRAALGTSERSLALAALLYRSLAEPLLEGPPPQDRGSVERAEVRATIDALATTVGTWRRDILGSRLDPYLARDREHVPHRFMMLKSMPQPPPELRLAQDTLQERWGHAGQEALDGWLDRHPYADSLTLDIEGPSTPSRLGIHDIVDVGPDGDLGVTVRWEGSEPLDVSLPAGSELTWADVLRLVDEAHRGTLEQKPLESFDQGDPLRLPLRRERFETDWLADFWLF